MKARFLALAFVCFSVFAFSQSPHLKSAKEAASKGFWAECYELLDDVPKNEQNTEYKLLLAKSKIMLNRGNKADEDYIFANDTTENKMILLLRKKESSKAIELALAQKSLSDAEKYLLGLAFLEEHDFAQAENFLGFGSVYAIYYTAYAQYVQNKTQIALENFIKVTNEYPAHPLAIESFLHASKCAISLNNNNLAIQYALTAQNRTQNKQKQVEAALLASGIYVEQKEYTKAINLLKPLSTTFDKSSIQVRFKLAELYAQNGDIKNADQVLESTLKMVDSAEYAEEASFKRGELFYKAGDYKKAKEHFAYCRQNFSNGKLYAQTLYYSALCAEQLKASDSSMVSTAANSSNAATSSTAATASGATLDNSNESILYLETLVKEFPNSSNIFYAYKTLATLYLENNEYQQSLKCVQFLQENFPTESAYLGLEKSESELQLLLSGENKNTVDLKEKYEKAKKTLTKDGRKFGVELASVYINSVSDEQKGVDILKAVLSKIPDNETDAEERMTAAKAAYLLGLNKCVNAQYIEGSEFYIKAANYYAGIDDEKTSESLFKACQSLWNARKAQDASLVCKKLESLFPNSIWAAKAKALVSKGSVR